LSTLTFVMRLPAVCTSRPQFTAQKAQVVFFQSLTIASFGSPSALGWRVRTQGARPPGLRAARGATPEKLLVYN